MKAQYNIGKVTKQGLVLSTKMDKTIVVSVKRAYRHPIYRKIIKSSKNYKVHDPASKAKVGDFVEICETRPISKTKRWQLTSVIKQAV